MVRRRNVLNDRELSVVHKSKKSYVEMFEDALSIFTKNCELRNLRPHTIGLYRKEVSA
ncbi:MULTISPECIES: hypothetical protein [Bacillus]|uniref:hypothetical protein n=1 Tax=Bacillus TaxID=1386 RepID=UPI0002EAB02C|nr:hypothetical protein [Bacillus pseudomycoides]KFN15027.1 integrase/recombinase domain protein [Bacillus pseudomycoides]MCR8859212.1 hypothetical protein [Bacillus pseudomycoides]MED0856303.1 hypothetical protein [Bacillus pseudomycoides]MED1473575.1 hypothetical protein [Bacillus pseudomycoides]MED1537457.1 hypothetical protein [Bacillus pseudomycoides]